MRELRQARGWSQTDLAAHLRPYGYDLTQSTVAKLEAGSRPTRLDELDALAGVLSVPLEDLIRDPDRHASRDEEVLHRQLLRTEAALQDALDRRREAEARVAAAASDVSEFGRLANEARAEIDHLRTLIADARGDEARREVG